MATATATRSASRAIAEANFIEIFRFADAVYNFAFELIRAAIPDSAGFAICCNAWMASMAAAE